jgi:type IV pilus assembly protein PilM
VDLGGERVSADTAVVPVIASAPEDTSIAAIAARMAAAETGAAPAAMVETIVAVESVEDTPANEVAQAVSVASAYFEDTLESAPALVLAAGTLGADALTGLLDSANVGPVAVQEIVDRQMLGEGAASAGTPGGVPLGWLAGVRGALAN